jgi:hypothetical protein
VVNNVEFGVEPGRARVKAGAFKGLHTAIRVLDAAIALAVTECLTIDPEFLVRGGRADLEFRHVHRKYQ